MPQRKGERRNQPGGLTDYHRRMAAEPLDVPAYRAALDPDRLEEADWRLIAAIATAIVAESEDQIDPSARWPEVLPLVAEGLTDREIAERMGVADETVKSHMTKARFKLGARNRAHMVTLAIRNGLIPLRPSDPSPIIMGKPD